MAILLCTPSFAEPLGKAKRGDWPMWGGSTDRNMVSGESGIAAKWDIDCEYNRNQETIKRLSYCKLGHYEMHNVVPDIIVHRRGTDENLLVIEVKKTTNSEPDDVDIAKLEAFHSQLGYKAAVFYRFLAGSSETGIRTERWVDS